MSGNTPYQERALSAFILGMFLIKLTFFLIITNVFISPNVDPGKQINFACDWLTPDAGNYAPTSGLENDNYGDLSFQSVSDASTAISGSENADTLSLLNIAKCAFDPSDVEDYLEKDWGGNIEIINPTKDGLPIFPDAITKAQYCADLGTSGYGVKNNYVTDYDSVLQDFRRYTGTSWYTINTYDSNEITSIECGDFEFPWILSFLLFSFWGNMLLFIVFIRTKFKV